MVKRAMNKIGQFIPISSMAKIQNLLFRKFIYTVLSILMAIFLLVLFCPWITLAIKSKMAKEWAYALINFCNSHFVGIDELRDANCAHATKKDPNDL